MTRKIFTVFILSAIVLLALLTGINKQTKMATISVNNQPNRQVIGLPPASGTTFNGGLSNPVPAFSSTSTPLNLNQALASGGLTINSNPGTSVLGASTGGGYSAGGGGYSTGGTAVDPQASLIADFAQQKSNIYSSATDAANNAGTGLNGSILDYLTGLTQGQRAIDTKSIGNEQSRLGGIRGVQDAVGQGIRSGGVQLANRNAGNSSASEALARAYGIMGRQQLSQVGQQYAQGQQGIANDQQTFNENSVANARKISDSKTQTINQIVADANNSLVNLDSRMAYANLPDRLALDQEKQNIRNQTLQLLSRYDQQLQNAQGAVHPQSQDAIQGQAFQLQNAGVAPDSAFSFDTAPAPQFAGTGPFASDLPLFQLARQKRLE